ncbi:hypothetical protein KM043_002691 [Ampulex compressa]|nr:hypothetical protein KM043_002691 [Ampulex compressa]
MTSSEAASLAPFGSAIAKDGLPMNVPRQIGAIFRYDALRKTPLRICRSGTKLLRASAFVEHNAGTGAQPETEFPPFGAKFFQSFGNRVPWGWRVIECTANKSE